MLSSWILTNIAQMPDLVLGGTVWDTWGKVDLEGLQCTHGLRCLCMSILDACGGIW